MFREDVYGCGEAELAGPAGWVTGATVEAPVGWVCLVLPSRAATALAATIPIRIHLRTRIGLKGRRLFITLPFPDRGRPGACLD
jgi:hypothetical protein